MTSDERGGRLRIGPGEVHVWRLDLDLDREPPAEWLGLLSPDERSRAARFLKEADRRRSVLCRSYLRILLGRYLRERPEAIRFRYTGEEKPLLDGGSADVRFNISHSAGMALLAFRAGNDVGVDVEKIRAEVDVEGISRRFFTGGEYGSLAALPPAERIVEFYRLWTRKESVMKATGEGFRLPPDQIHLIPLGRSRFQWREWTVHDISLPDDYAGSVASAGDFKLLNYSK